MRLPRAMSDSRSAPVLCRHGQDNNSFADFDPILVPQGKESSILAEKAVCGGEGPEYNRRNRRAMTRCIFLGLLGLVCATADAGVTLKDSLLTATSSSMSVTFEGLNVKTLQNAVTGETYIAQAGPGWMDLNLQSETGEVLESGSWQIQYDELSASYCGVISAKDSVRTVTLTVGVTADNGEVFFRVSARSSRPGVRSVLWGIQGFSPAKSRFVIPGQAGIEFDSESVPARLALEYPTHWEAQFAVYEAERGSLLVYAHDSRPYFKRLQANHDLGSLSLGLEVFAQAPWPEAVDVPVVEWRMKAFDGHWRQDVDYYRQWSDGVWAKRAPSAARDWAKQVRGVVVVVDPRIDYLDLLATKLDPAKTLLYLANWRDAGYDVDYPNYTPRSDIPLFMEHAHELGFHVMLHTSALGVSLYNAAYDSVKAYQLRDPDSEALIFWPWGLWPGGGLPPPEYIQSFAFISPASSSYRKLFVDSIRPMVESLQPDAVHLDAGGVMLNDANGLIEGMTSMEGMVQLHKDVSEAFPNVAFSFESMTEQLVNFHDFAQRWSSDYTAHPVSTYLMGDRVQFYGFLDQENPDEPNFVNYIRRYESQGILPIFRIQSPYDVSDDLPIASRILQMTRLFQKYQFRPDWDGDWTGLQFRWISEDGSTVAKVEDAGPVVRMVVGDQIIYERARRTSTLQTSDFIPNWTAYDDNNLYGLDPSREYWLSNSVARPSDEPRLVNLPAQVKVGVGSYSTADYGYFELDQDPVPQYDFIANFGSAKLGTIFSLKDYPLIYGGMAAVSRTLVAGAIQSPALLIQPPYRVLGGATYVEFNVAIPREAKVLFGFDAGISDFATHGDGVLLVVRVDGKEIWRQTVQQAQLVPVQLDVTPWAGKTVALRLITHPGHSLNMYGDLSSWSNLRLIVSRSNTLKAEIARPGAAGSDMVDTELPGHFVYFAKTPAEIPVGESLLDVPYEVWRQGTGGWPFPARFESSGEIQAVKSGDVVEERALPTIPPTKGSTLVTWAVHLPADASSIEFRVGLADPSPPLPPTIDYSGMRLSMNINGGLVWSEELRQNGWMPATVDLSKWQGQDVVIQIVADAESNAIFDWAHWAGLTIR